MTQATTSHSPTFAPAKLTSRLPALVMSIVLISFRPFSSDTGVSDPGAPAQGGDIVNQIGFGVLGAFCVWMLVRLAPREALRAFNTPLWWLAGAVLLVSVANADSPNSAMRAMIFSLIVVLAAVTALSLPRTMESLVSAFAIVVSVSIGACYFAVLFFPEQGVHQPGGYEAFHAGLWRGVYDHKNVASYVMGANALIAMFIARNGKPVLGTALFALALFFTIEAGSKTVLGVFPAALLTAWIAGWISFAPLRLIAVLLPISALGVATLGAVIHPPILETLRTFIPDLSYTGRTDLWTFGLEYLQPVWPLGYGFESFWSTPRIAGLEQPIELSWDVRGIVHGHNSWLDAMLAFGVPGALILFSALVVLPVRDYLVIPRLGNPHRLARLFIAVWVFTALGASLESFFFRRADPVWFMMLLSIVGLRITAFRTRGFASAEGMG